MKFKEKIDNFFLISKRNSTFLSEILAGIVTFFAMCYILTVNPNQIFYAGTDDPRWASMFIATALGAIIGTLFMSLFAKMPIAQAPGMSLNVILGPVIGGGVGLYSYVFEFTIGQGLMIILISGILFTVISRIKIKGKRLRMIVFDGVPSAIRVSMSVGIGLFIAYIGFQNCGLIIGNTYTQVGIIDFSNWKTLQLVKNGVEVNPASALTCLFGLFVITTLEHYHVKGAVFIGILAATIFGIPFGVTDFSLIKGETAGITWNVFDNFKNYFQIGENSVFLSLFTVFKEGFPKGSIFTVLMLIMTFTMLDMFDTMGSVIGCCSSFDELHDKNGVPTNYEKIIGSDAVATCVGACLGTSTVTTFVESGAGISTGGRTGLTSLVTAICFFLAIFLLPLFAVIPSAACASALVYVGVLMMKANIKHIDFSDPIGAVSAFLTIIIICLSYSTSTGIGFGIVVWVLLSLISYTIDLIKAKINKTEKPKFKISVVIIIIAILFLIYFCVPTVI